MVNSSRMASLWLAGCSRVAVIWTDERTQAAPAEVVLHTGGLAVERGEVVTVLVAVAVLVAVLVVVGVAASVAVADEAVALCIDAEPAVEQAPSGSTAPKEANAMMEAFEKPRTQVFRELGMRMSMRAKIGRGSTQFGRSGGAAARL